MQHEQGVLSRLAQQQRIVAIDQIQQKRRVSEEVQSLIRLQQKPESYLNRYDQLFRLISLWLLVRCYDLSNQQPHQVLKAICLLQCPHCDVEKMIQRRHQLKKGALAVIESALSEDLERCYQLFLENLQAYI